MTQQPRTLQVLMGGLAPHGDSPHSRSHRTERFLIKVFVSVCFGNTQSHFESPLLNRPAFGSEVKTYLAVRTHCCWCRMLAFVSRRRAQALFNKIQKFSKFKSFDMNQAVLALACGASRERKGVRNDTAKQLESSRSAGEAT